jgi:hypothetical protein
MLAHPEKGKAAFKERTYLKGSLWKARASTPAKLVGEWNDMRKLVSFLLRPFEITIAIRDEY